MNAARTDTELVDFDPSDAGRVAGWTTSAQESLFWCGLERHPMPPEVVAAWCGQPDVRAYLLREDAEPVGYGELWLDEQEVELARLIVAPRARGRGVGQRLVNALAAAAERTGAPLVFLRVNPGNAAAIACYLAAGWHEVGAATATEWNAEQPVPYRWFVHRTATG